MKRNKKIIYIDNDNKHRKKAKKAFEGNSEYRCLFCRNGEEGLKRIDREKPDVVVVDYYLPDFSGEEVFMKYLTDANLIEENIPFIALTTNGKVDKSRLYRLGFSACLGKPFSSARLVEFVEDVLVSHRLKMEEFHFWETIRESKNFLERVVESSADFIVTTDNKGIITYCNRACEEMLGYGFEELVGKRVSDFLQGEVSELLKIDSLLKKKNKVQNYETVILDNKKGEIRVNIAISTMKNEEGTVMGALIVGNTMGDEKCVTHDSNESDRLAAVIETAVAVNHEINNPLVPILGNAQFLLQNDQIEDEDIRKRLRSIVQNALRIRDITQKLARIRHPVTKEYLRGTRMLDIEASI